MIILGRQPLVSGTQVNAWGRELCHTSATILAVMLSAALVLYGAFLVGVLT